MFRTCLSAFQTENLLCRTTFGYAILGEDRPIARARFEEDLGRTGGSIEWNESLIHRYGWSATCFFQKVTSAVTSDGCSFLHIALCNPSTNSLSQGTDSKM